MHEAFDILFNHAVEKNGEIIAGRAKMGARFVARAGPAIERVLLSQAFSFWARVPIPFLVKFDLTYLSK